jgi:hypothetical protein
MQKIIIAIIIAAIVVVLFGSASFEMWDNEVHIVKSPEGDVVCAYVKAVGMTGHKKFLSESQVMKYDNFTVIEYQTADSTENIIDLSGRKAWVNE